ncbi:MAG TPA: flagellar biosynthesis protein FlhB [Chloroflexota bacterium]|nr:flagellar biosynthesis protein FlhB [Chloroflexota bacterium]
MAAGERTEAATPRRLQELREQGRVVRSTDLTLAASVLGSFGLLHLLGGEATARLTQALQEAFATLPHADPTEAAMQALVLRLLLAGGLAAAPLLLGVPLIGLAVTLAQVGLLLTGQQLAPQLARINPIEGWHRLWSARSAVELLKTLLKAGLVTFVLYQAYTDRVVEVLALGTLDAPAAIPRLGALVVQMGLTAGAVLLALGLLDYGYQRWEFRRQARMTRQEVREELRQQEGDPRLRARLRSLQRRLARRRMMAAVPKADVVITNPTHLAVALAYHSATMQAPKVVAKGADLVALRIRTTAQEHGVPIVENPPLARALYRLCELEQEIPVELYHAVAEVLAYIYSLRQRERAAPRAPTA